MAKRTACFEIADQHRLKLEYPGLGKDKEGNNHFMQKDHVIFDYPGEESIYIQIKVISKKEFLKQKKRG